MSEKNEVKGQVIKALGNMQVVEFEGDISLGCVAFVQLPDIELKAEVIEINGNLAKIQIFEDARGVKYGTPVVFRKELIEVELGPGLLSQICDGMQNPLPELAEMSGLYLPRGVYLPPLNRIKRWEFTPAVKVGDRIEKGDVIGRVPEANITHQIMLPFHIVGSCEVTWVIEHGNYTIETTVIKVKDENGNEFGLSMLMRWPIKKPLCVGKRVKPTDMLSTGLRFFDTKNVMLKGGTAAIPGPFGSGKTVCMQHLAKYSDAHIVVICACGERAGEVVETLKEFPKIMDVHTNAPLISRTVIICNTSSMPVAAREASVYVGITISEYYRQMGLDVLMIADSTSRWAQAMREMAGRLEELPADQGFPAYLGSRIAAFYERAGKVELKTGKTGSCTVIGAVSPAGGMIFSDAVALYTLSVVGAFYCLSKECADARIYPAFDVLKSWSQYTEVVGKVFDREFEGWSSYVKKSGEIMTQGDEIRRKMEVVGIEGTSIEDQIIYLKSELFSFAYLQQNAFDKEDAYAPPEKQKSVFKLICLVFDGKFPHLKEGDEAKSFFLDLQNRIKQLNYLSLDTEQYKTAYEEIREIIEKANTKLNVGV